MIDNIQALNDPSQSPGARWLSQSFGNVVMPSLEQADKPFAVIESKSLLDGESGLSPSKTPTDNRY